jgi:hypothetical protein
MELCWAKSHLNFEAALFAYLLCHFVCPLPCSSSSKTIDHFGNKASENPIDSVGWSIHTKINC